VVSTLNNLEQIFQTLARLPTELSFELFLHDGKGGAGEEEGQARVSTSSSASDNLEANDEENGEERGNTPTPPMAESLAAALDHADVVIYTILETMQDKVRHIKKLLSEAYMLMNESPYSAQAGLKEAHVSLGLVAGVAAHGGRHVAAALLSGRKGRRGEQTLLAVRAIMDVTFKTALCLAFRGNYSRCLHVFWESLLAELSEHADASSGVSECRSRAGNAWHSISARRFPWDFGFLIRFPPFPLNCTAQEKEPIFFDRLHEALQILAEFFFADGRGIMGPKLYTPNFNKLDMQFSLNGVSDNR